MTKRKTRPELAPSLDADLPPGEPMTLADLIAEARAVDWDFAQWCYVSGHDASDSDARNMFECLRAYGQRRGPRGLALTAWLLLSNVGQQHRSRPQTRQQFAADSLPCLNEKSAKPAAVTRN